MDGDEDVEENHEMATNGHDGDPEQNEAQDDDGPEDSHLLGADEDPSAHIDPTLDDTFEGIDTGHMVSILGMDTTTGEV